MDRLTLYDGCGSPDLIACMDCGPGCGADNENCGYCERPNEAYARLAAYENLCLTPEEIEGLMVANGEKAAELARLRAELERVTAERDAAVEERDTLMRRNRRQVEVIRRRIDAGGLSYEENRLLRELAFETRYDRRGPQRAGEGETE